MRSLNDTLGRAVSGYNDTRVRATWRGIVPWVVASVIQLLTLFGLFPLLLQGRDPGPSAVLIINFVSLAFVSALGILFALAIARRWDERSLAGYGIGGTRMDLIDGVAGVIAGGLMYAVPTGVFLLVGGAEFTGTFASPVTTPGLIVATVVIVVIAFLLQVTFEEFVFRSVMLQNFSEGLTARGVSAQRAVILALLVSSVLFGVMHVLTGGGGGVEGRSIQLLITSTFIGLLLGGAYVLTERLSMAVGLHFGHNVWSAVILQPEQLVLTPPAIGRVTYTTGMYELTIGKLAVGIVCLLAWVYMTRGEIAVYEQIAYWKSDESATPE